MKTITRVLSLALAIAMLFSVSAMAEDIKLPSLLVEQADFYSEAGLDSIDRVQEQVAAYEADLDMLELPDIDIYVLENTEESLEDYAAMEASMFGAFTVPSSMDGEEARTYTSSELYDDQWYIVRNDIFSLDEKHLEEICWYYRTDDSTISDSEISIHLPYVYVQDDELITSDDVYAAFTRSELAGDNFAGDPECIEFIHKAVPEGLGVDDVVIDYATRTDAMTEQVTINGRNYYKIAGWLPPDVGLNRFTVLYLIPDHDMLVGVLFLYENLPNGFDLAVMETTGF